MDLWDKIWKNKQGHIVIWQMPNIWLIAWAILDFASILTTGHISNILWWGGEAFLIIWSLLEIVKGVNYFRRALGLLILILAIATAFKLI